MTPRYRREISEAVGRAELAGKPDEQRQAWASAQNLSRQQASAQKEGDFDKRSDCGAGNPLTNRTVRPGSIPGSLRSRAVSPAGSNPARSTFVPLDPAPVKYVDPDVWYRRVGVAMCVVSATFVAFLGWQIVRWAL